MILIMNILFISVIVMLIISWSRRSAIWGGATIGLILGGLIGLFAGDIFQGGKTGLTIGGIIGVISEVLGSISNRKNEK